ncbi:MAG: phosphotransferase [Hyphomicrobiaceae bacterium]|nr:phosphotransferase [Hyphomicrobiaceae bacterium]
MPPSSLSERQARAIARSIIEFHLGSPPDRLVQMGGGLSNRVYTAHHAKGPFIVRFGSAAEKIEDFLKEQWVLTKVREKGVPTPEILQVGTEPVSVPYMVSHRVEGRSAVHHPQRLTILREMGRVMATIHTIRTSGYGSTFDWSQNVLSRNETWAGFLRDEWEIEDRIGVLEGQEMLDDRQLKVLRDVVRRMSRWDAPPVLNHGDLRLKNVLVDDDGAITAIIDWEDARSCPPPCWDLALALHDLSIDAKEALVEGYGLSGEQMRELAPYLKALNVLHYASVAKRAAARGNKRQLNGLRTRLSGAFDLFL